MVDVFKTPTETHNDDWCREDPDEARDVAAENRAPDAGPLDSPAVEPDAPEPTEAEKAWAAVDPEFRAEMEAVDNSDADRYAEYIVRKICHAERDLHKAVAMSSERISELEGQINEIIAANAEIQELHDEQSMVMDRAANITAVLQRRVDGLRAYYEQSLRMFAQAKTTDKVRSVKLLYGTLSLRWTQPALVVDDKEALLEWAREHDKSLIVETVPANPVKAIATRYEWVTHDTADENGEITGTERILVESATKQVVDPSAYPAGIHIEQAETFTIKTEEAKGR